MSYDLGSLRNRAEQYRESLNRDPANCDVRLDLAWCILLQALHHAAQPHSDATAQALFAKALKEAFNVSMISNENRHIADLTRIEFVCALINQSDAIGKANTGANVVLRKLAGDMAKTGGTRSREQTIPIVSELDPPKQKTGRKSATSASPLEPRRL